MCDPVDDERRVSLDGTAVLLHRIIELPKIHSMNQQLVDKWIAEVPELLASSRYL